MMTTKYMLGELRRPSLGARGVICPNQLSFNIKSLRKPDIFCPKFALPVVFEEQKLELALFGLMTKAIFIA